MKKSILIGVLAALMLFAFTACDNSASNGIIYRVEAVQNDVFVEGETPDPAGFTFTGYTAMGDAVKVDAADVKLVENGNKYQIFYQGDNLGYVTVDFEKVTKLTVDASADEAVYYATVTGTSAEKDVTLPTERKIDTTGIVVKAEYDGGSKVLDNDDLTFALATGEVWTSAKDDVVVDVKLGTADATYKIDIEENLIKSVAMATTEGYEVYSDRTTAIDSVQKNQLQYAVAGKLFTDDAYGLYMVATYEGGEVVYVAATDVEFNTSGTTWGALTGYTLTNLESITVTARYKGVEGIVDLENTVSTDPIAIVKDSITGIEVGDTITLKSATNYGKTGTALNGKTAEITVAPVWASGYEDTTTLATSTYVPTEDVEDVAADTDYWTFAPADFTDNIAGQRVAFTVTAVIDGETYTKDAETVLK